MTWRALNLAADEFEEPPAPPDLCGLIYRGRRHLVSGVPESNKTLFALIVGLEQIRAGGRFALIDFESGPQAVRRMLTDLGATRDEIASVYYVEDGAEPTDDDVRALLDERVDLAIVDASAGAFSVSSLDDNKRQDAEFFGRAWIDPLWSVGIGTVLLDHVVKSAEARGRFAIGSERKAGRTDVHLGLEVVAPLSRGRVGLVRIATHKDRPGFLSRPHAAELEIRSDPETHALTWQFATASTDAGEPWAPTELMGRVSQYLQGLTEPVTRGDVERNVRGKGKWIRVALDRLIEGRFVLEERGPGSSRLVRFNTEFVPPVPGSSRFVPGGSSRSSPPSIGGDEDEAERLAAIGRQEGLL